MKKRQLEWVEKYPSIQTMNESITGPRKLGSEKTVESYVYGVQKFLKWLGSEDPEAVLDNIKKGEVKALEKIDKWIDYLLERYSHKSTLAMIYGVKKWLETNGVRIDWHNLDLPTGSEIQEIDSAPTRQQLITLMNHASLRERAVIEILASSGLRIGTLLGLTVGDIDFGYPDVARITVERRPGRKFGSGQSRRAKRLYVSWITPEAREILQEYLKERERAGEKLTEQSPLISDSMKPGEFISADGYRGAWLRLLDKSGLEQMSTKWHVFHIHTLRKYFRSNALGVNESFRENWMGHRGGYLDASYFKAEEDRHLEEYRKAIPYLSIYRHVEDENWRRILRVFERARERLDEDKMRKIEEILAKSRNMDEAIEGLRRLHEKPTDPEDNHVKIVKGEMELLEHLKQGWNLVKELNHDKYLLKI